MSETSTFALAGDGLRAVTWDECDAPLGGCFTASPADAEGRGLALTVTRGGEAVDLSDATVYLLWRHRERRVRGCEPFEAVNASAGAFRVFWPAAMACAEGAVDAQVMVASDGEAISTLPFVRSSRARTPSSPTRWRRRSRRRALPPRRWRTRREPPGRSPQQTQPRQRRPRQRKISWQPPRAGTSTERRVPRARLERMERTAPTV